ncbi:MAG: serine/threonine protein phosphatase [Rhodospirillaceae bacterium]|nr:serine/threonine protein phosphatase [Rhodospirillaceae bacterium]
MGRSARPLSLAALQAVAPPGLRIYAIGDIHGRADLLGALHDRIEADAATAPAGCRRLIVYLGDYVDRGLQSRQVIDMLLEGPPAGFEAVYLKGNHEDCMLRFLDDWESGPHWFSIGGDATALSYGVRPALGLSVAERFQQACRDLKAALPPAHLRFLESLELVYEAGDYVFVHAGLRPGVPLDEQDPEDLMWIRDEFLYGPNSWNRLVVHGHSPSREPAVFGHRIGIDTGAFFTNVLTCLVLEGAERRFISTAAG